MKRVLALLTSKVIYGKERSNIEVYHLLEEQRNVKISVVCNRKANDALKRELSAFQTIPLVIPNRYEKKWRYLIFAWTYIVGNVMLWWNLMRFRPQLLMMNSEIDFYSFYPALKFYRGPIVYRVGDAPAFKGLSFYRYNSHVWNKYVLPRVTRFVCISQYIRKTVQLVGRNSQADKVIYNYPPARKASGITETALYSETQDSALTFGFLGQVFGQKGVHHYVESALRLLEEDSNMMFYVAGSLSYRPDYAKQVCDMVPDRWKKNIIFLGEISGIESFFSHIDVLCVPSIKQEPLGNVLVEAKRYSKPCVIYPTGGMPELITNGVDGFVCDSPTADALYKKMKLYVGNRNLAIQQGYASKLSVDKLGIDRKSFEKEWGEVFDSLLR